MAPVRARDVASGKWQSRRGSEREPKERSISPTRPTGPIRPVSSGWT